MASGVSERRDRAGRVRYRVRVRRGDVLQTATLLTLDEALAWRAKALSAADGVAERPERPKRPVLSPSPEPPGRVTTVEEAARRLCRGVKLGTVRTNRGRPYKPSTLRKYEENLRVLVMPRIGGVPVATLTLGDCQRLVDELAHERTPEHDRKALTALRVALRLCQRYGELDVNPCAGVRVPADGDAEKPARILTPEECSSLVAAAERDDARLGRSFAAPLIALAVGGGLRMGELLALPWGAEGLDLDAGLVQVRRSLDRVRDESGAYPFVPPKFGRWRTVPLAPEDVARLRRHRLATGRPPDGSLVFGGRAREALSSKPASGAFRRACTSAGIAAPLPRPHDCRHAFATHALAAGLSPHAVAALLGHADAGLVYRRYGHALPDEVASAGNALSAWRRLRGVEMDTEWTTPCEARGIPLQSGS